MTLNEAIKYLISIATSRSADERTWAATYKLGWRENHYPVPAIPLQVVWPAVGYMGMVYIDSLQHGEDDPMMRCCWDFYDKDSPWYGKYQPTYTDAEMDAGWSIDCFYTVPTYNGDYVDEVKYPK
jgi:hypothetical protein